MMAPVYTTRILQFGGGNFLRCFFDWMLQKVSDATGISYDVTLVQLTPSEPVDEIAAAGEYHVLLRGYEEGRYTEILDPVRVLRNSVSPLDGPAKFEEFIASGLGDIKLILSNSTEAGIFFDANEREPHNYPSFLARLLFERANRKLPPVMLMAMELNERSGDLLKSTLLKYGRSFGYGEMFRNYVEACPLYNTLVDRIVPGYPADAAERIFAKIGRTDKWLTCGELFHLFVLEGDEKILDVIPFGRAGLNVLITPDKLDFYHERKVRILNGAHTSSVPVALLRGIENVDVFASDEECSKWLSCLMHDEICFALDDSAQTHAYAEEVLMRFRNPVLGHKFRTISLNSVSKADTRMTPTLRDYFAKKGTLPKRMTEAARKLCDLYGDGPVAKLPGGPLELNDYSQIKGQSLAERIDCFFPSTPHEMREAMLLEFE